MKRLELKARGNKKGLSPIIATTILIALVVVIALMIFLWFKSSFREQVTKFGKEVSLSCEEASFNAEYVNGILTVSNNGNVPIYQVRVMIDEGALGAETKNLNELSAGWPSAGLSQEDTFQSLDLSQEFTDAEKIVVIPVLLGDSDSGQKAFACDEQYGITITLKE